MQQELARKNGIVTGWPLKKKISFTESGLRKVAGTLSSQISINGKYHWLLLPLFNQISQYYFSEYSIEPADMDCNSSVVSGHVRDIWNNWHPSKKSWMPWIFHYMPVTQSPLNKGVNFMHGMLHEAIITLTKNPLIQQKYWSDMFAKEIHGCVPFLSFIFYPSLILTTPSFAGRCWKGLWYLLTKVSARSLQVLNRSSFSMQWLLRTFISNLFI